MNDGPIHTVAEMDTKSPVLLIPYVWIGDFVRCHTVVRVLKERWPDRPVDVLTNSLCAPLVDYMPGVRSARSGTCRVAGLRWPSNGRWRPNCGGLRALR